MFTTMRVWSSVSREKYVRVEPFTPAVDAKRPSRTVAVSAACPPLDAMRQPTARIALRTATHDIHERMHRHPALARLAAGTIGRDEYCRVLARSYGFYAMAEPVLGLGGSLTQCLRDDLAELGMTRSAIGDLPRCAPLAIGQGAAQLIGARYVLLGASLGGKVMARAMAGRTDGHAALPVRFLTGLGENDLQAFVVDLEKNLPDPKSQTCATTAATVVFAAYEDWMAWHE